MARLGHQWTSLIVERLIDYIRLHVSRAGGLTPCRKMAALAVAFSVRTLWHGSDGGSRIVHACNVAFDRERIRKTGGGGPSAPSQREAGLAVASPNVCFDWLGLA